MTQHVERVACGVQDGVGGQFGDEQFDGVPVHGGEGRVRLHRYPPGTADGRRDAGVPTDSQHESALKHGEFLPADRARSGLTPSDGMVSGRTQKSVGHIRVSMQDSRADSPVRAVGPRRAALG